jgi:hypothetical protein
MRRLPPLAAVLAASLVFVSGAAARVLLVGSYHGIRGQFSSIQAAVDAAKPNDWILIGPGDYKTSSFRAPKGAASDPAGVLVTKAGLYLRGMNRNTVIVDGTKPGSAPCSRASSAQNFGPRSAKGPLGLNGIMVWKATDVWVQNLTACNFLGGAGDVGNEVWWNGGGAGKITGHKFVGSYLNATSTFFAKQNGSKSAAKYGIFSSNWSGGTFAQDYASNFSDSGFYIGACKQQCNQIVDHVRSEWSALGYSGSNSGGRLVIKNSEFDNNNDGFDTNSQNGDNPPPQDGSCPNNGVSPITHTHSCWVFMNNYVHDNNNPNVPKIGAAGTGPVGTGMTVTGGRNDTVMNNRFVNNKAWGIAVIPYPDSGPPCTGGTLNSPILGPGSCLYDEWGDALIGNKFSNNGGYGNPTNGDFDQLNFESHPSDCYRGNTDASGHLSPDAAKLEQQYPTCTTTNVPPNLNIPFLNEILCDTQVSLPPFGCQPGDHYPRAQGLPTMHPLPRGLKTMPNPCAGVPSNPWCPSRRRKSNSGSGLPRTY